MFKRIALIMILFLAIMLFSFPAVFADATTINSRSTYDLPMALEEIEEEAFAGTAAEAVILPEGISHIGKKAFYGMQELTDVFIPETTEYIEDNAFSFTSNLVIHGVKGSYAEEWAKKHRVPFVEENIWKLILDNSKPVSVHELGIDFLYNRTVSPDRIIKIVPRAEDEDESKRPQDRPELNPIDYRFP